MTFFYIFFSGKINKNIPSLEGKIAGLLIYEKLQKSIKDG